MPRLVWGQLPRNYEAGVDRGVLYLDDGVVLPWSGLLSIEEQTTGNEVESLYFDGVYFQREQRIGDFTATVEAFTYPVEFEKYFEEPRKVFGLSYQSGTRIHLVYNVQAALQNRTHVSIGESTDTTTFTWSLFTKPVAVPYSKPSAHLYVDTSVAVPAVVNAVKNKLYGTSNTVPVLPTPTEIMAIFEANAALIITDNGDGTWTATGPDSAVKMTDADSFEITWPSAVYTDADTFDISTW